MTETDRRKLMLGIVVLFPTLAWVIAVKKTEGWPAGRRLHHLYEMAMATPHKPILIGALIGGFALAALVVWLIHLLSQSEFKGASFVRFLRGTQITSVDRLIRKTRERNVEQIHICNVPIPTDIENLHFLIGGGTGAGKSTIFNEMAFDVLRRRDRMFCLDPNGAMMSKFYQDGDVVLNPYDQRTQGWSFFNEIRADYDFERYAVSIVPRGKTDEAEEWAGYGRLLLRETAKKLSRMGRPNVKELFRWTTLAAPEDLKKFLEGTLAESLFVGSSEASKALSSARFILSDKLPQHVTMPPGAFSLRKWLDDPEAGNLWITWREDMAEALKPLISAWTDALFVSLLSMPQDEDRKVWAFIDELASLEKLATLEAALTKGRKHGVRVVAGLQATSQVDDIYGHDTAKTLRSCFSSLAVLRVSKADPATADMFSKSLGEHEVEREKESSTVSPRQISRGQQTVHEPERVITASELTSLSNHTAFVAFCGDYPITRTKTKYINFKTIAKPFVERSNLLRAS